jgi:hypothetical protein
MNIEDIINFLQDMDRTDESYYQLYLLLLKNVELKDLDNDSVLVQS